MPRREETKNGFVGAFYIQETPDGVADRRAADGLLEKFDFTLVCSRLLAAARVSGAVDREWPRAAESRRSG